jgi:Fur family ferric uptake transcriptional regulator
MPADPFWPERRPDEVDVGGPHGSAARGAPRAGGAPLRVRVAALKARATGQRASFIGPVRHLESLKNRWYGAAVETPLIDQRLRDAGLRVTAPRVAVLRVLADATDHPRIDQVLERVRSSGVSISTQTGYDVCEALHRASLARRIEPAGGPARYEGRVGDDHQHLVCRSCAAVADVDCTIGAAPCLDPSDEAGFVVDEAEVIFWGVCPECQSKRTEGELP